MAAGLAFLIVGVVAAGYLTYSQIVVKANKARIINTILPLVPTATPTPDPLAPYSILLMGYAGGMHDGGLLTDSMMLVKVAPREETVTMVSIPRDLWVPVPIAIGETKYFKINAAYAIGRDDRQYANKQVEFTGKAGGGEMTKAVVESVVGFKIDYFAALDFNGFTKIVDILGGVDVKVVKTFTDPMYPIEAGVGIGDSGNCGKTDQDVAALTATMSGDKLEQQFPCRYEALHFDRGLIHMDGTTALKFARSRHSPEDGGDFNRAARQRLVILAAKDKILSIGFITKIIPTIKTLTGNLTTDVDIEKLNKILVEAATIAKYRIIPVALTDQNVLKDDVSDNRQYILIPKLGIDNWDEVRQFIDNPTVLTQTVTPKLTTQSP